MIAPRKPLTTEPEGLWSAYVEQYLDRLKLQSPRHYVTGKDILARFTAYAVRIWVADGEELGEVRAPRYFRLTDVTFRIYQKYVALRCDDRGRDGKKLSKATVNKEITYLNSALRYAQQPTEENYEWLGFAPPGWRPPRMKRLRQPKRKARCLDPDLLRRVFEACRFATTPNLPGVENAVWWQTLYCVGLVTGVRREALLGIPRPTEQDLAFATLKVPAEFDKEKEAREFHLPAGVVAMIRRLPPSPDGRLFAWPHCVRHFYRQLERWQFKAGITKAEKALPHDLRRTKGTLLTRQGLSLALVSDELGHASIETTRKHYIGTLTDERIEAVEQLFKKIPLPDELMLPPPPAEPAA